MHTDVYFLSYLAQFFLEWKIIIIIIIIIIYCNWAVARWQWLFYM